MLVFKSPINERHSRGFFYRQGPGLALLLPAMLAMISATPDSLTDEEATAKGGPQNLDGKLRDPGARALPQSPHKALAALQPCLTASFLRGSVHPCALEPEPPRPCGYQAMADSVFDLADREGLMRISENGHSTKEDDSRTEIEGAPARLRQLDIG